MSYHAHSPKFKSYSVGGGLAGGGLGGSGGCGGLGGGGGGLGGGGGRGGGLGGGGAKNLNTWLVTWLVPTPPLPGQFLAAPKAA
jgi:hypothetical protein